MMPRGWMSFFDHTRIKGDSVMANLTFDKTTDFGRMSYLRLSSPTDLVQGVTGEELKKYPKTKTNMLPMNTPHQLRAARTLQQAGGYP
jgi:hypothetical protein